jgi:hypothetical protein
MEIRQSLPRAIAFLASAGLFQHYRDSWQNSTGTLPTPS